jgi:hypothetical protein
MKRQARSKPRVTTPLTGQIEICTQLREDPDIDKLASPLIETA